MNPFANPESLTQFLSRHLPEIDQVHFLDRGLNCHIYAFTTQGQECILRVAHHPIHTHKEAQAYQLLGDHVPIPAVLMQGTGPNYTWAVTQRCSGQNLAQASVLDSEFVVLSNVLDIALTIHRQSLPLAAPAGIWGQKPIPKNWSEHMGNCHGFMWHQQRGELLDQNLFEYLCREIRRGVKYCPEQLWLIHGDFKPDNLILNRQQITGVIDWATLGAGDFVYDLAGFGLYADLDTELLVEPYYQAGFDMARLDTRWRMYTLHHLLGALWSLSQGHQRQLFEHLKQKAINFL